MAVGLLFMFISGLYMVNADISKADQYKLFQIHKAAGIVMLWAICLRLIVRCLTKKPELPDTFSLADKKRAGIGHVALYVGLLLMPLSGWLMVSSSPFGLPTFVFVDWIKWPHIPGLARNKTIETVANNIHWITAIVLFTFIVGHIFAVIWHKKSHKINLVHRMWWFGHKKVRREQQ